MSQKVGFEPFVSVCQPGTSAVFQGQQLVGGGGLGRSLALGPASPPGSVLLFSSWEAGPPVLPQFRQLCQDCDAVQPWQCLLPTERVRQSPKVSPPGEAGAGTARRSCF